MSVLSEVNRDALTLPAGDITRGKRLGFLEAFEAAYQDNFFVNAQFGAEYELRSMEIENFQRIRSVQEQIPRTLQDYTPTTMSGIPLDYTEYTAFLSGMADGGGRISPRALEADEKLDELKRKYPGAGILTYTDMFNAMREKAQRVRMRASRDTSWTGYLGWFTGGTVGGLDPRTNPLGFYTLPAGGFGKTAVQRIASQGVAQGVIEGVAQFTGVRENMRILGFDPTIEESLYAAGGAAIGGAALQGVGEGLGVLGRRWFRNTPDDPAPPAPAPDRVRQAPEPSPAPEPGRASVETVNAAEAQLAQRMAPTLEGEQAITRAVQGVLGKAPSTMRAARADFAYMRDQLSRFDGPLPWEVVPPTHTRLPTADAGVNAPRVEAKTAGETVDDIARRVDPETFRVYDNLQKKKQQARNLLDFERSARDLQADATLKPMREEVARLEQRYNDATKRNQKKQLPALEAARKALADAEQAKRSGDNEGMARARKRIMEIDEKMRDLAPAVSRAYTRAEGKWKVQQETLKDVERMIAEGRTTLEQTPAKSGVVDDAEKAYFSRPTVADSVPELRSSLAKPVPDGKDAVDEVQRVAVEMLKKYDEQIDNFRSDMKKVIAKDGEDAVQIEGVQEPVKLSEKIVIEDAEGLPRTMTVREMIEELDEAEEVLKVIGTCSVGVTSATA